jgi:hypothetical protein
MSVININEQGYPFESEDAPAEVVRNTVIVT